MNYDWLERIDISNGFLLNGVRHLPTMNFEQIVARYEEWAKHNRRWELVLYNSREIGNLLC